VRDGLLPLIWFFTRNPAPGKFSSKLYIHSDFEEFVPEAWRAQVELYTFFPENQAERKLKISEVLLTGLVMPSMCSLTTLRDDLENIVDRIGGAKALKGLKVRAYLPAKFEITDHRSGPAYYSRYIQFVCAHLGTEIEFMEYENLRWAYFSPGALVHDFNDRWLIADSYLNWLSFSKVDRPHTLFSDSLQKARKDCYRFVSIFPNLSCGLRKSFKKPFINYLSSDWAPESQERVQKYFSVMHSPANRSFPWPEWFGAWCNDFAIKYSRKH
jgi:hypothetical protein